MKRVYTATLFGEIREAGSGSQTEQYKGVDSYVAQEDIEIIGCELTLMPTLPMGNDGLAWCRAELSQTSDLAKPGIIMEAPNVCEWNTTPAFGEHESTQVFAMFPEGKVVPLKEEGRVYLNYEVNTESLTAGFYTARLFAIIYYTKKSSK